METQIIWWMGISLAAILLFRGAQSGNFRNYPLFYFYVGSVLLKEIVGIICYRYAFGFYGPVYWSTELVTIIASYAVIVEIFRQSFRDHPGVARNAQKLLLVTFVLTLSYAATDLLHGHYPHPTFHAVAEAGRDLRYIEGALLLLLLWLFVRYRILLRPGLRGLIAGYSFWIGLNVINLAVVFLQDERVSALARRVEPATYNATLIIWCAALWSVQPAAAPAAPLGPQDYDLLAAGTRSVLARTSGRFSKVMKP